jgi:hypothetical protein
VSFELHRRTSCAESRSTRISSSPARSVDPLVAIEGLAVKTMNSDITTAPINHFLRRLRGAERSVTVAIFRSVPRSLRRTRFPIFEKGACCNRVVSNRTPTGIFWADGLSTRVREPEIRREDEIGIASGVI